MKQQNLGVNKGQNLINYKTKLKRKIVNTALQAKRAAFLKP
jgi:hypothetical protein